MCFNVCEEDHYAKDSTGISTAMPHRSLIPSLGRLRQWARLRERIANAHWVIGPKRSQIVDYIS